MNQLEQQRVIEALRALTGGLTVTEQDINIADARLRDNLEPPSPRRRLALLAAAAAAVLAVAFVVFQTLDPGDDAAPPTEPPTTTPADSLRAALQADAYTLSSGFTAGARPTAQDLAGFWLLRAPYGFTLFVDGNGGWRGGTPLDRQAYGTSTVAGNTWTRRFDDGTACAQDNGGGLFQSWRAALAGDGSLRLQLTGGEPTCTPADTREVWDRVDPGSPVADYLLAMSQEATWQSTSGPLDWEGVYVAPESGHVLAVTRDGSYRYYDTLTDARLVAADRGDLESAAGTVTGTCAAGAFSGNLETTQVPGVDGYVLPFNAIRIATTTDSCASGIAAQGVWVNVAVPLAE